MTRACVARVLHEILFATIPLSQTADARWTVLAKLNAVANPRGLPVGASLRIPLSPIPILPARGKVIRTVGDVDLQEQVDAGELHGGDTGLVTAEQRDSPPVWLSSSLQASSTLI